MNVLFCSISLFSLFSSILFASETTLSLGDLGSIRYISDDEHLLRVERLSPMDEVVYSHSYHYNENGRLVSESLIGGLGEVVYEGDLVILSPFGEEECEYNAERNLVKHTLDGVVKEYNYNEMGELQKDSENKLCLYDAFGNLTQKGDVQFVYDEENRLVQVITNDCNISYEYDECTEKRISRTMNGDKEYFIYSGINEIAIIDEDGWLKELRIPGLSTHQDLIRSVAIETRDAIYAPIHDIQGNIIKLINIVTKEVLVLDRPDPFGNGLSQTAPTSWIFAGKHYDKEAGLIYFGSRYYSPDLAQWISVDPLCQTMSPYQYCLNNPFCYTDPNGEWAIALISVAWGAGATITSPFWVPAAAATTIGMGIGYFGYKMYENWKDNSGKGNRYWEGEKSGYQMNSHKAKDGKQKDGTPKTNTAQNDQFKGAVKEIEKKLGKKLTDKELEKLHDHVTKQGYGYHDIVDEGYWLFK